MQVEMSWWKTADIPGLLKDSTAHCSAVEPSFSIEEPSSSVHTFINACERWLQLMQASRRSLMRPMQHEYVFHIIRCKGSRPPRYWLHGQAARQCLVSFNK